jgi:hypothetical protein
MDVQRVEMVGDTSPENLRREISATLTFFKRRSVLFRASCTDVQIYDDCVRNQVFFFVVTNLRQWVFGSFVSIIAPISD